MHRRQKGIDVENKKIFSGIQPTGNIHLGNYLGALKQFVELQESNDCVYCIVDMHAITVPQDPKALREHIKDVAALYLAVGLDPKKSIIFVQSEVPAHAELSWILTTNTYNGELSRMTQFKSKARGKEESAPTGLFAYPVLMAADILLYDTEIVPVGDDQKQHIELTRDLAQRVNHRYPDTFVMPEGWYPKAGARIMALDEPTNKMSKSAENEMSRISLLDDEKKIKKAIMRATTDNDMSVKFDPANKPGISNLLTIYSALGKVPIPELEKQFEGAGYGDFKKALVEVTTEALAPIREKYLTIRDSSELDDVLDDGAKRAAGRASVVLARVKENFGLGRA